MSIRTIQRLEHNGQCAHETLLAVAAAFDMDVTNLTRLFKRDTIFENISDEKGLTIYIFNNHFNFKGLTPKSVFFAGLILIFPAIYFLVASVAKYNMGMGVFYYPFEALLANSYGQHIFNFVSPILFKGGLVLAIFLNLGHVMSVSFYKKDNRYNSYGVFILHKNNLLLIGTSSLCILIMISYVLVENFVLR